jgi:hypothetical protein
MIIEPFAVKHTDLIQNLRKGENNMVMPDRVSAEHPVFNPESLPGILTFRTMTVTTTIIAYFFEPAFITSMDMSAQSRCPAR